MTIIYPLLTKAYPREITPLVENEMIENFLMLQIKNKKFRTLKKAIECLTQIYSLKDNGDPTPQKLETNGLFESIQYALIEGNVEIRGAALWFI